MIVGSVEGVLEQSLVAIQQSVADFGDDLTLLCSGQDAVLIDLAMRVDPSIEITFIDTGFHFNETIETMLRIVQRYSPQLRVVVPWRHLPDVGRAGFCCSQHKVKQLEEALRGKRAWMSGVRRADGEERASAELRSIDRRGLAKVNPLVDWTDEDVEAYIEVNDIIVNPLRNRGYASIGCAPCTTPDANGRDGRWAGLAKTECGIHR